MRKIKEHHYVIIFFVMFWIFGIVMIYEVNKANAEKTALTKQIQQLEKVFKIVERSKLEVQAENELLHKYIFEQPQEDFMRLICAVIETESGGNANARNKQSQGIMQINGGSFDAEKSVISGSKMLASRLAANYPLYACGYSAEDILHKSLTEYNRGVTGANRYRAKHGHFNSDYSKKVLKKYREFKNGK